MVKIAGTDQLLTVAETAEALKVTRSTLNEWRRRGHGPRWFKLSPREVRYRAADIEAFLAECEAKAG